MTHQLGILVSEILGRHFGDIVQKVGNDLFTYGIKPLALIIKTTGLSRMQVIESLRTLIKYDLALFEPSKNELLADYRLNSDNILLLIRYPRYLLQIKSKFGYEAECIIEETLLSGVITATRLLVTLANKYKNDKEKNITLVTLKDTFISLATAGYLQQAPVVETKEEPDPVPILTPIATIVPEIDIKNLYQALNGNEKNNDNVYWKVSFERFHQDFRDDILVSAMTRLIDENAGELMRQLLVLSGGEGMVTAQELRTACERASHKPLLQQYYMQYLKLLEESAGGFVNKCGEAGGGQYCVRLKLAATTLVEEILDHAVTEKLGSKAARIFRLIRSKKFIEEEDIQKQAMLPDKESKMLTYKLIQEHFASVRPIRKPASSGTMARTIYLYYVNLHEVAKTATEVCHTALHISSSVSRHCLTTHARLRDKQRRVRSIVHGMRLRGEPAQNIADIEETITPPERLVLQGVEKKLKQLSQAEIELDKCLFILQWYFTYKT